MTSTLDWSAFRGPVAPDDVRRWRESAQAAGHTWARSSTAQVVLLVLLLAPVTALFAIFGLGLVGFGIARLFPLESADLGLGAVGILVGAVCLALAALMVIALTQVGPDSRRWERWMRLDRFARANGLEFSPSDPDPNYPGAIFHTGSSRAALDHLRPTEGRFFDLGNYRFVTSSGKSTTTHTWGFLAMHLERRLPHMMLDAVGNNTWGGTGLGASFDRSQVLSLEGDFDRYFTLYCPREYERDALYVFTPDLMALCIDEAAPFDIEIVDDWMLVYSPRAFVMHDPALLSRLFRILDLVGAKALRQTRRYQDDRMPAPFPANIVAHGGRRLRARVPVGLIVALAVVLGTPLMVGAGVLIGAVVAVLAE